MKEKSANNLRLNTITGMLPQIATIISGFLVPRLILEYYGSSVNGLVQSIAQFLSIISFLEAGVGSVIRFNLYKPLYEHDNTGLSKILVSSRKFFRTIAKLLIGYTLVLMLIYPFINQDSFSHIYTASLIASMSISYFAQYYFGQVNQLLLTADQKGYIQCIAQTATIVVNVIASVILIQIGAGIHLVKLSTSLIFLIRPLFLEWYVKKNYQVDYQITYSEEPIKQKWNGLAQHITAVILESTDVVILTIFSTFTNVSIYSAYHMVVYGIKTVMTTASGGIEAYIGNIIASDDKKKLNEVFGISEWVIHNIACFIYGCTLALIVPFIMVYTRGITDADYRVPLFACLITLANMCHTLRLPYSIVVLTAGHYKKTQHCYVIATVINIVVSVIFVKAYGLVGVAIGTLVSMSYQIAWLAIYSYKKILKRKKLNLVKQMMFDVLAIGTMFYFSTVVCTEIDSYSIWIVHALKIGVIFGIIIMLLNVILYSNNVNKVVKHCIYKKHK